MKNYFCSFFLLLILGTSALAGNPHPIFSAEEKLLKNSPMVQVFIIDPIPVFSIEQLPNEEYIYDYKIVRKVKFKKKLGKVITDALLDTTQYISEMSKKCPFMGTYAVKYVKGKHSLTVVISADPCGKIIVFSPGSKLDKKHIDIKDNSTILAAIRFLCNPAENKIPGKI